MTGFLEASLIFAVDVALKATLLFAVVALAVAALSRSGAAARHFVATAGLVAALALPLLALVLPRVEVPLWSPLLASERHDVSTSWKKKVPARAGLSAVMSAAPALPVSGRDRVAAAPVARTVPVSPARPFPWKAFVLAAWAAGAVLIASRLAFGLARVRTFRREASEIRDAEWSEEVRTLAHHLEVARPVSLFVSDRVPVALTSGLVRPFLLLCRQARQWAAERRRVVLLHELAHVKRTDWIWLVLAETAFALYWWHPLAWVLTAQVRRDAEKACDDLVLAAGTKPSVYAGHLLGIFRSLSAAAHPVAPAVASTRPSHFEGRLRSILDPAARRPGLRRLPSVLSAASVAAAAAGLAVFSPWAPACSEAAIERPLAGIAATPQGVRSPAASDKPSAATCPSHQRAGKSAAAVWASAEPAPDPGQGEEPLPASGSSIPAVLKAIDGIRSSAAGFVQAAHRLKKGDESGASWYSRAMDLHHHGRYDEAIAAFQKAIEAGYREDASAYNIACAYARQGNKDKAFEWLRRALDAGFEVGSYLERDDDLYSLRRDPRFREMKKAAHAYPSERAEREAAAAAARYERLSAKTPKSGEALYGVGKDLLNANRYDLSAKAFGDAAALGYRTGTSLYNQACALSRGGQTGAALDRLEKALDAGFDQPDIFEKDDDLDNVRDDPRFGRIVKDARDLSLPGDGIGWLQLSSMRRTRWREAARRFEEYALAHPARGRAWFNLGFASLAGDRPEAAAEAFARALNRSYRRPTTMYNLACSYARLDQRDKAFDWLFQALSAGFDGTGMLRGDEDLDNLRGDPRFRKALDIARSRENDRDGD
jgi:beta-lactamase regulating signal transducer with metallopeptidase domain/tetratricopeptide (TPR) repeat protein